LINSDSFGSKDLLAGGLGPELKFNGPVFAAGVAAGLRKKSSKPDVASVRRREWGSLSVVGIKASGDAGTFEGKFAAAVERRIKNEQ